MHTFDLYSSFAFISYSHRDMGVAKWLQRRLEAYRLPTEIHNDIEVGSRYLRPIFRDQSDLNSGILTHELRKHLEQSKFLILICSKNSAQSAWVSDEAKAFVEMGRLDHIIPVIIPEAGVPDTDLFPTFLRDYFKQYPDRELLGISFTKGYREKALIRIVSRMLDVAFDSLWQRHQRQQKLKLSIFAGITVVALMLTYLFAIPVTIDVDVSLQKAELPYGDAIILNVDGAEYQSGISNSGFDPIVVSGYKRFTKIPIVLASPYYQTFDTLIPIGYGIRRHIGVELKRDESFGIFAGRVYNEEMEPLCGAVVSVSEISDTTDSEGLFCINVPLALQREELPINVTKYGFKAIGREDETPGRELKFIIHRN